jgi:hypothetical protein
MRTDRSANLDLLALAEEVAADRRTLSNVIDQIAVAEPDDDARRQAVSELQSLVMTLTAVRRHARATGESHLGTPGGSVVSEKPRVVQRASVRRRAQLSGGLQPGLARLVVGTGMVLLAVAVVAAIATTLGSTPSEGGPATAPAASFVAASAVPTESQPAPSSSTLASPSSVQPTAIGSASELDATAGSDQPRHRRRAGPHRSGNGPL